MWKLWFIIQQLRQFSREATTFLGKSEELIEQNTPEETHSADVLRHSYRRILVLSVSFPIVCGVIAPIGTACIVFTEGNYHGSALVIAVCFGMLFSLPACFFYLFAGVAVGCLLAPDEFMDSPVGEQWLKLIGTKNRVAARAVCFVVAVVGLLITTGICVGEIGVLNLPGINGEAG